MTAFEEHDGGLWVPRDAAARVEKPGQENTVVVDNQSGLPDDLVLQAVETHFVENTAAFGWNSQNRYMSYQSQGSMLGRANVYRPPSNVIEEIQMCRDLAERDDDIGAALDAIVNAAYKDGFQNQHEDEQVQHTFDEMTEDNQLLRVFKEAHREWLISGQLNSATLYVRGNYDIRPEGVSRVLNRSVATPLIGVLPAEKIRVVGDDTFFNAELAFAPDGALQDWLRTYFDPNISAGKKAEMRRQYPVRAAMFIGPVQVDWNDQDLFTQGATLYKLNPDIVHRTTMPKGEWHYPRPPLTRNLPLLEAKRMLNVMDYSLLQGGSNYIVVVKKGSDNKPALPQEIQNLEEVVRRASRSGVLIGDHRLTLDVVTPDLTELLNAEKRRMIGRKLSLALLRIPEFDSDETGQSVQMFGEMFKAAVTSDRSAIREHIHRNVWKTAMKRNQRVFGRTDRPLIWFPRLVLQGEQFFQDYLLKMYDRGDLPRRFMVEYGGFDYDSVKAQKEREIENDHDSIFTPPPVPFSSPNQGPGDPYQYGNPSRTPGGSPGPQDSGPGRPRGSGPNNGRPGASPSTAPSPARPRPVIRRTRGETVRAYWDDDQRQVIRIGEVTDRVLAEYESPELGRLTPSEERAIRQRETVQEGRVIVVPVSSAAPASDVRPVRLGDGSSLLVGHRVPDGALVTVALAFREPEWNLQDAEDAALRWGFDIDIVQADDDGDAPGDPGTVQCPKCGQFSSPNSPCANCGFDGPPFKKDGEGE